MSSPTSHPFFTTSDIALLSRSDGHYTVAALVCTKPRDYVYKLHWYHSDNISGWSSSTVSAAGAWKPLPADTPRNCYQILVPHMATVVTIGGECGTVGWVDLWRGILLYDVLDPNPAIRGVPLPLPLKDFRANNGFGKILGYPGFRRGISFVRDTSCLKLVHMDVTSVRLPGRDEETWACSFRLDDWALTMWSNKEMSDSLDDWHEESSVKASKITIDDDPTISQMLDNSGLRVEPQTVGSEQRQQGLQNLAIFQPIPCDNGKDVVYLMARKKFMHPMVWMLALEMKNGGRLQGVVYCGHQEHHYCSPTYCLSRISRCLYPKRMKNPAAIQDN